MAKLRHHYRCPKCRNRKIIEITLTQYHEGYVPPADLPCGLMGCEGRMIKES